MFYGMNNEVEQWKEIPGFPGNFVSSLGRAKRVTTFPRLGVKEIILTINQGGSGYVYVGLMAPGVGQRQKALHRLVAFAFVDGFERDRQVNHKDGDRRNCRSDNLEWMSASDNQKHAWGLKKLRRKYSAGEIALMRQCHALGMSGAQLSRAFATGQDYMCKILSGERRKNG